MSYPNLPLSIQNDVEQNRSWEGISTPNELAHYMARVLSVDPNDLIALQEIVYSSIEPTGESRNRLWIKTGSPVGIGIPTGSGYSMIYEYPVNSPFLWTTGTLPAYVRKLTNGELDDYSLTAPKIDTAFWVIYSA